MTGDPFLVLYADQAECDRIRRVVRKLPLRSPLRRVAEELLNGVEPDAEIAADHCIEALCHQSPSRWRVRLIAAWILGVLPVPEAAAGRSAEALARVVDNYDLHRDSGGRAVRGIARSLATLGGTTLFLLMVGAHPWIAFPLGVFAWLMAMPASLLWDHRCVNVVREEAARALGRTYAPEYLGALTQAANDPSHRVKWASIRALHQLLPRILSAPEARVPRDVGSKLCGLLKHADPGLGKVVLSAIPFLAGPEAIQTVERVAERSKSTELREQAKSILPALYEMRDRFRESETLLRPADEAPPDNLLRPYTSLATSAPELLLRPTTGEDPQ
jgi:hypothetical protein